jgi:hypothetical protein
VLGTDRSPVTLPARMLCTRQGRGVYASLLLLCGVVCQAEQYLGCCTMLQLARQVQRQLPAMPHYKLCGTSGWPLGTGQHNTQP